MARQTWHNDDGLVVKGPKYHGDRSVSVNTFRELASKGGRIKEAIMDYDLALLTAQGGKSYTTDRNNDGVVDGFNGGDQRLPKRSSILRVTVIATETAVGGTTIKLGTFQEDGTAILDNDLITVTEGVTANLAAGMRTYGAGAKVAAAVGTAGIGAADVYMGLTAAGTFTAGKGVIIVEYVDPLGDTA